MTSKAADTDVETPELVESQESDVAQDTALEKETETAEEPVEVVSTAKPAKTVKTGDADDKPRRRIRISLDDKFVAVAVLFALTAAILTAAFTWRAWDGAKSDLDAQKDVRRMAGEYANSFLTYDYNDLDSWQKQMESMSSPDYRKAMTGALGEMKPIILSSKAIATTTVRDVFIAEIDGSNAKAIVVSDHEVKSTEGTNTQAGMRTYLELVKKKGQWLINGLGFQGVDSNSATDASGQPIKPTVAPAPSASATP